MERIFELGAHGNSDDQLSGFRADDGGSEVELCAAAGSRRHRLAAGDRFEIDAEWHVWDDFAGAESEVTLVRAGGERIPFGSFRFDLSWGGWMENQIAEALRQLGCEVTVRRVERDHRKK